MHRLRTLLQLWLALAGTWIRPCIPAGLRRFLAEQRMAQARRKAKRRSRTGGRYDQILADVVRELKNSRKSPRRRAGTVVCANRRGPRPSPYFDDACYER
jgi:fructosamine-3-kinase